MEILLCLLPLTIPFILKVIYSFQIIAMSNHKQDLHKEKILELEARRALHESKIARENNTIMLQDLKIESEKLKLEQLEKLVHPIRFNPDDDDESPRWP